MLYRWEMRTRLFLRTAEFLWQKGHTAHATKEEAIQRPKLCWMFMLVRGRNCGYSSIARYKTEGERFAGALETYCIEALMQDGRHYRLELHISRSEFCQGI